MMFISIVIPTYNRRESLVRCLVSLKNQTYPQDQYEVIVVEDGSRTEVEDFVHSLGKNFSYYWQNHRGPAVARNKGIKRARGEVVAFTDDDCAVPRDWLRRLAGGYRRYPVVAGVGGFMGAPQKILSRNVFARYESYLTQTVYGALDEELLGGFEVPTGGTNNISYKRELLSRVGGFDETFPVAAGEDADLKKRICNMGYSLLYIPLKVEHYHQYSFSSFLKQSWDRGIGSFYFHKKHGGGLSRGVLLRRSFLLLLAFFKDILAGEIPRDLAFLKMAAGITDYLSQLLYYGRFKKD